MKTTVFTGVCTALVTPFVDGKLNEDMVRFLLHRQIGAEVPAVAVSGTTGEAPTLSDQEKLRLIRICKEEAQGRCQIIAGTGSNDTAHAITLSKAAELEGADALLVVSPYYNKATPDGLIAHYSAIARAVHIPIIAYNVPSRTGVDIPVSVYKALAAIPNFAGVKEASADITKITKIRQECPENFIVWTGNDTMIAPAIACGAAGVVSVYANLFPKEAVAAAKAALDGDREKATMLQGRISRLSAILFREVNPIPVKAAMALLGMDCGGCRLPLTTASAETRDLLQKYFSENRNLGA